MRSTASPATAPAPARLPRKRLAAAMTALAKADPAMRQRAEAVFVQPLKTMLDDLRDLLKAQTITRENLPKDLTRDWVTPDGQARVDVAPKGDPNNNDVLRSLPAPF